MDPSALRGIVARYDWRETFVRLAMLAAMQANIDKPSKDTSVQTFMTSALASAASSTERFERQVAGYVGPRQGRPLVNEAAIYFLEAMTVLYGNESRNAPTDGLLAFLLLAANDYYSNWLSPDAVPLTNLAGIAADQARARCFNRGPDQLNAFVRGCLMLREPPSGDNEWRNRDQWLAFQAGALGTSLEAYVEGFAGPLFLHSKLWGQAADSDLPHNPSINPNEWLPSSPLKFLLPKLLSDLCVTRTVAKDTLSSRLVNGLPISPTLFYRKPFVAFSDSHFVAASPWVVREHIRGGLWGKHLEYSKATGGPQGANHWLAAFGYVFEQWCRRIAQNVIDGGNCPDTILLSDSVGSHDEIEDVVVSGRGFVALCAAKARTIPEMRLKGAESRTGMIDFFEEFLFANDPKRLGVVRQLDAKIHNLKAGAYKPKLRPGLGVLPVVVTYDDMGTDSPAVYRWVRTRCNELGLLKQSKVRPLTFAPVHDLETLLALGANGRSIVEVLERKTWGIHAEERLDVFLFDTEPMLGPRRLRWLEEQFEQLTGRVIENFRRDVPGGRAPG